MTELIRDTAFGHLIRFITRNKALQFQEEADPSIWTRYIDEKKSGYLAHHGDTSPPDDGLDLEGIGGVRTREDQFTLAPPPRMMHRTNSYMNELHHVRTNRTGGARSFEDSQDTQINQASGVAVDPEKGRDVHLVSWYGENDPGISGLDVDVWCRS